MKGDQRLRRILGPVSLTSLGVGAVIGAGIFVATGKAANGVAGPALMLSYVVAGITCIFAALCYAEFASMAPVAGSAYTYAYTTMGELFAWIIGWDLVLEYAVGAAAVANGWSGYFQSLTKGTALELPKTLQDCPLIYKELEDGSAAFVWTDSYVNLPAILITLIVTIVLVRGIQESAIFNTAMVALKLGAVVFVILVGAFYINPANWENFAPFGWTGLSFFGIPVHGQTNAKGEPVGMIAGAAIIFFAYIGFDSVSTHAEEAKNPQRDVPIGIIASLLICTVLYVGVVVVLTGMVPYTEIKKDAGVSEAFASAGLPWAKIIIACAGVAGITSVLLVMMLSAPRVFLAMARDGLVPKSIFASVHPTYKTPWISTILIGVFVAVLAGLLPIDALLHLTNIGTLFAFVIVCGAVLIMRKSNPDAERPFRCPFVPVVPILGILCCLVLMFSLPAENWWRLFAWLGLGLIIYFCYGMHNSVLGKQMRGELPSTNHPTGPSA
ncbi:MAG: amino acid permease [Gemmataceae bacterium]|nr:amino acid permease [Gemmataceae bacterium]